MKEDEREELLAEADELWEEGRAEEVLALLERLGDGDAEAWLFRAAALQELGDPFAVEDAFERARELLGEADPHYRLQRGAWETARWNLDEAHRLLDRLERGELDDEGWAAVLERRAFLAEVEGELERADRLYAALHQVDPDEPVPPRLDEDAFLAEVEAAAAELPPAFRAAFETIAVVIDPMPTRAILGAPESGFGPDLLGLYEGPTLAEFHGVFGEGLPPRIHLFQRNLERVARDEGHLREEIRVTLYHELGHALGFDEDGVDELGLG